MIYTSVQLRKLPFSSTVFKIFVYSVLFKRIYKLKLLLLEKSFFIIFNIDLKLRFSIQIVKDRCCQDFCYLRKRKNSNFHFRNILGGYKISVHLTSFCSYGGQKISFQNK